MTKICNLFYKWYGNNWLKGHKRLANTQMRANFVVCCLSHFFFRGSDLFSITAQSAVVSNADMCVQPQLIYGAGEDAGREVVHWRFRESGQVVAWRRCVVSEPRASGRAKELFVTVSLPLSRPLVSRPYVGLTTGPPRRASEMDGKCYCLTELG